MAGALSTSLRILASSSFSGTQLAGRLAEFLSVTCEGVPSTICLGVATCVRLCAAFHVVYVRSLSLSISLCKQNLHQAAVSVAAVFLHACCQSYLHLCSLRGLSSLCASRILMRLWFPMMIVSMVLYLMSIALARVRVLRNPGFTGAICMCD